MDDEPEEIQADQRRQLRFAGLARAKDVGRFDDLEAAAGGQHDIDEDLEAVGRKPRREPRDDVAADHEEAAHRIADRDPGHAAEEPGAEVAELLARRRQAARRRLVGDARADREIAAARRERFVHFRQDRFVVLQVAVDHRDEIGARRQPALDHRARQAEAIDAPDAAQARIARRQRIGDVGGAVGRIVVDDDHFPRQAGERRLEPLEQDGNVGRLAVGRHDHGEGRPRHGHRRIRSHFALDRRRARRFARGDVSADTAGKGARQAMRAGMSASGISSRPPRPQRQRLRRIEAGEIGAQLRRVRIAARRSGDDDRRVPADEARAVVEKRHAARIVGKDEHRHFRPEREGDLAALHHLVATTKAASAAAPARRATRPSRASRASDRPRRRAAERARVAPAGRRLR